MASLLRFTEFRFDKAPITDLADGSIRVVGQLTHPGIFVYRNPDGSARREYRPKEEVLSPASMSTYALASVTVNHPPGRPVTAATWKKDVVGHLGENIRADGDNVVADVYIRDAATVAKVKAGELRRLSCGYRVANYEPVPGETPTGERYDGVQRGLVGNHVALLPNNSAPRGGPQCTLRLDAEGDEIVTDTDEIVAVNSGPSPAAPKISAMDPTVLQTQIAALQAELAQARTDSAEGVAALAELKTLKDQLAVLQASLSPERLDSLVEDRAQTVATAKAAGVALKSADGKTLSTAALKRAVIAAKTPSLASRADAMSDAEVGAVLSVYATLPSTPHPSMQRLADVLQTGAPGTQARVDSQGPQGALPTVSQLRDKAVSELHSLFDAPVDNKAVLALRKV